MASTPTPRPGWTFLSNHAHVLVYLGRDPRARVREVGEAVGITERAVLSILADLEEEGIVERIREGRRNRYVLHRDAALRHPLEEHRTVGELLRMVEGRRTRHSPRGRPGSPSGPGR
jgi:DNA-binding Lrp family transcriptional regulator